MIKNGKADKIFRLVLTALFAALITLSTAFLKINTGLGEGYIHLGDAVLYICAAVLPFPFSCLAAAVGAAFADILTGCAVWVPFTLVIKSLNTLPFLLSSSKGDKILTKKSVVNPLISGLITVFGYFLSECILYSVQTAKLSLVFNIIQATVNAIAFYVLSLSLDKINFKQRIRR